MGILITSEMTPYFTSVINVYYILTRSIECYTNSSIVPQLFQRVVVKTTLFNTRVLFSMKYKV